MFLIQITWNISLFTLSITKKCNLSLILMVYSFRLEHLNQHKITFQIHSRTYRIWEIFTQSDENDSRVFIGSFIKVIDSSLLKIVGSKTVEIFQLSLLHVHLHLHRVQYINGFPIFLLQFVFSLQTNEVVSKLK